MSEHILSEDLAVWFGKKKKKKGSSQPKGPWVNICKKKKGGGHPPCGRKDADEGGYPVCRGAGVAGKMSQKEKDSACRRKREKEKKDPQTGKGQKPTRIKVKNYKKKKKNEAVDRLVNLVLENNKPIISEDLKYHLDNKIRLSENVYRYGSPKYFKVINEARKLYNEGYGDWSIEDIELLESDRGKFFIYGGERLPLDFPMINESEKEDILKNYNALIGYVIGMSDKGGENKSVEETAALSELRIYYENLRDGKKPKPLSHMANVSKKFIEGEIITLNDLQISQLEKNGEGVKTKYNTTTFVNLDEAEYKGKDVKLNKPKKGGSKKWYVYVRNPKTGKIKKVSYGSPVMTAKWNDPAARKSFAARHQCHKKKDKTKAGYWACRAHKDFGKNVSGRYW